MNALTSVVTSLVEGVRSVNRRYAKPSIEMTPFVKVCLLTLRVYLFVLVALMVYKFIVVANS